MSNVAVLICGFPIRPKARDNISLSVYKQSILILKQSVGHHNENIRESVSLVLSKLTLPGEEEEGMRIESDERGAER